MFDLQRTISLPCETPKLSEPTSLATSEEYIAIGCWDFSVHVYSIVDGTHKLSFNDPCGSVWALCVVGDEILVGGADGVLRVWDVATSTLTHTIESDLNKWPDKPVRISSFHAASSASDRAYVLVAAMDGSVRMRRHGTSEYQIAFLGQHKGKIAGMQSYGNDNNFVSADYDGTVCAWTIDMEKALWKTRASNQVFAITIAGEHVILGDRGGSLRILSLHDGTLLTAFNAHHDLINGLILHQEDLISTSIDGFVKVWTPCTSQDLYELSDSTKMHDHAVVARCRLGLWLITGGKEGGGPDNSCGIDMTMKAWKLGSSKDGVPLQLGTRVPRVYHIASSETMGKVFCIVMKRGKPVLEFWEPA